MIAIEKLYRQYAPDVFRFAFWLCGDRAEAEDLTSYTFVRDWVSPKRIRSATVKGLLFTIARNLYLRQRSRAGRYREGPDSSLPDPAPGPSRSAQARDALRLTLAGLATLPEVDRAALLMRAEHGMPYAEISAALEISVAAARVKVHRARLKLTSLLASPGETPCKSPAT